MKYPHVMMALAGLAFCSTASADDCPDWKADTLTGDWGRAGLCERGVTVDLTFKTDALRNMSGGNAKGGAVLMNAEAAIGFDLEKLAGWEGTTAFVLYHAQHGNTYINDYTGSFAGVSNIETGTNTGQFYQAWLQKDYENLSVLTGLYAIDSEFYVTDSSGLFLQPPYGMSAEMAQSGRNGPPVFPMGALGVRLKYTSGSMYVQAAITDGVPGNPNDPHGTWIKLDKGDGTLVVTEFGLAPEVADGQYNKTAVGFWRYTTPVADLDPAITSQYADQGMYIIAERTLKEGLSGFARFGVVNKDAYQSDWSASVGLNSQGLRDSDEAGIAVTTSHASTKYQSLNASKSSETIVELTYRAQVNSWLAVQPSMQYFMNPNMDPALKNAWVVGARIEAAL